MERKKAWGKIRQSIPGLFYDIVRADKLENQIRLCTPILKSQTCFTPLNDLVQYHREIRRLDEEIERERQLNDEKQKEYDVRWNLSYERLNGLNKVLEKFVVYREGCQKKIESSNASFRTTQTIIESQDREIRKLHKELEKLLQVKKELEERRNLCESLKYYLDDVVRRQDEHGSIQELIARYEDLKRIRQEICVRTIQGLSRRLDSLVNQNDESDRERTETTSYISHKASLEKYRHKLLSHNGKMNEGLISLKKSEHSEILQIENVKQATYTLYLNLCCEMKQTPTLSESDIKGQLAFIQKFLQEMAKIKAKVGEFLKGDSDIVTIPDGYIREANAVIKQKNYKNAKRNETKPKE